MVRSSRSEVFCKRGARVSFLIKMQALSLQLYLKRDSGTGVFL